MKDKYRKSSAAERVTLERLEEEEELLRDREMKKYDSVTDRKTVLQDGQKVARSC